MKYLLVIFLVASFQGEALSCARNNIEDYANINRKIKEFEDKRDKYYYQQALEYERRVGPNVSFSFIMWENMIPQDIDPLVSWQYCGCPYWEKHCGERR